MEMIQLLEQNLRCGHGATPHPLGIVGLVANFQGMPQILALEPRRAPQ